MSEPPRDDASTEDRPRIKVTDRRLFDREGRPRKSDADEAAASPPGGGDPGAPEGGPPSGAPATAGAAGTSPLVGPEGTTLEDARRPEPGAPEEDPARAASPGPSPTSPAGAAGGPAGAPARPSPGGAPGAAGAGGAGDAGDAAPGPDTDDAGRIVSPHPPSAADLPRDFGAFVEGLYFEAMLYMGAIRHPQTGQLMEEVDLAKYKIDLLGMLQDKTEGNLSEDEAKLLEDALYQLRMLYLQKTGKARF